MLVERLRSSSMVSGKERGTKLVQAARRPVGQASLGPPGVGDARRVKRAYSEKTMNPGPYSFTRTSSRIGSRRCSSGPMTRQSEKGRLWCSRNTGRLQELPITQFNLTGRQTSDVTLLSSLLLIVGGLYRHGTILGAGGLPTRLATCVAPHADVFSNIGVGLFLASQRLSNQGECEKMQGEGSESLQNLEI